MHDFAGSPFSVSAGTHTLAHSEFFAGVLHPLYCHHLAVTDPHKLQWAISAHSEKTGALSATK